MEEIKLTENKTFMFIYGSMLVGGVEMNLIRLIRKLKENGNRVIWLAPKEKFIDETLKSDLLDGYVEIIDISLSEVSNIPTKNLSFKSNEEVIAFAFDINSFLFLEVIKDKFRDIIIHDFFWVSHFQGLFAETQIKYFKTIGKKIIKNTITKMTKNNNILFANIAHINAFEERYNIKINNTKDVLMKQTIDIRPFEDSIIVKKSKREQFNIISVTRFDFPHKAYLFGLINAFKELKESYNSISLTIIGYGNDEDKVRSEISKLEPNIKKDINLVGKVAYDELIRYFNTSHINIGLAGTIVDGALSGVISIPVRHYSTSCEAYGYLPDSKEKIVSDEPGTPVIKYIKEVIEMNDADYIELCRKSYNTFALNSKNEALEVLTYKNLNSKRTLPKYILWSYKMYKKIRKVVSCL